MVTGHPQYQLDPLDLALIRELEGDARQTNTELASKLSTSETTVRRRIQKMLNGQILTFVTHPNTFALGYEMVLLALTVHPGKADIVAEQLASRKNVHNIVITSGPYEVIGFLVVRSAGELYDFITNEVGKIPHIIGVDAMQVIKVVKNSWALLNEDNSEVIETNARCKLDKQDWEILAILETEPRVSYRDLARKLGVSRPTAANRIQGLMNRHTFRIMTLVSPRALGGGLRVGVWMKIQPGKIAAAAEALHSVEEIRRIVVLAGKYDIIAWAFLRRAEDITDFLKDRVSDIPGIVSCETALNLRAVKTAVSIRDLKR